MIRSYTDKVIAIDFDGTLCTNNYPYIGKPKTRVIKKLKREQHKGAKIILWTCRTGALLEDALYFCREHNINLDAVNENIQHRIELYGTDPRKVGADEYWDDKARRIR